jgi:peptidoglycan/LPS O-acetylase OafA/YrhL
MMDATGSQTARKFIQLEAARGIASIIVVFHHFSLAFLPWIRLPVSEGGVQYTPAFIFINGTGAVTFFFLLSGFVLTYGFYQKPSDVGLARAVVKRLPRLMVPASITILVGWLIYRLEPPFFIIAATESRSDWLAGFASAGFPAGLMPTFGSALKQILLVFLVPHYFFYNSNLWTMFNEFYGSLLVFALSAVSVTRLRNFPFGVAIVHIGLALVLYATGSSLVDFVIGSGIAYWMAQRNAPLRPLRKELLWAGMLIAVVGFSCDRWIGHACASSVVMLILLSDQSVARVASGRSAASLGLISFPIYLVHTLVILGLSSWVFSVLVKAGLRPAPTLLLTLLATLGGTALSCLPLVWIESTWIPYLNALMRRIIPSKTVAGPDDSKPIAASAAVE